MIILLFLLQLMAQDSEIENPFCIRLETVSIGCLPAPSHPCLDPKAKSAEEENVGIEEYDCKLYKSLNKNLVNKQGPLAFKCKTWEVEPSCEPGEQGNCTDGTCQIPHDPVCAQECKTCVEDARIVKVDYQPKGCSIDDAKDEFGNHCRPRCADEPYWEKAVYPKPWECEGENPPDACKQVVPRCEDYEDVQAFLEQEYKLTSTMPDECRDFSPCPKFAVANLDRNRWEPCNEENIEDCPPGAQPVTTTGPEQCDPPEELPPPPEPQDGKACPWIRIFGESRAASLSSCEEIPPECKWENIQNGTFTKQDCADWIANGRGNP